MASKRTKRAAVVSKKQKTPKGGKTPSKRKGVRRIVLRPGQTLNRRGKPVDKKRSERGKAAWKQRQINATPVDIALPGQEVLTRHEFLVMRAKLAEYDGVLHQTLVKIAEEEDIELRQAYTDYHFSPHAGDFQAAS